MKLLKRQMLVIGFIVVATLPAAFAGESSPGGGSTVIFTQDNIETSRIENVEFVIPTVKRIPIGFSGRWLLKFTFLNDSSTKVEEEAKAWFNLELTVTEQENGTLTGVITMQGDDQKLHCTGENLEPKYGAARAAVDSNNPNIARGEMKMCWDEKFWPIFKIDLDKGWGIAVHRTASGSRDEYMFDIERIKN